MPICLVLFVDDELMAVDCLSGGRRGGGGGPQCLADSVVFNV